MYSWQQTVLATGPGLAIRIICGDEPYQGSDFAETNIILGQIVDFVTAVKKVSDMAEIYMYLGKYVYEVLIGCNAHVLCLIIRGQHDNIRGLKFEKSNFLLLETILAVV